VTDSACSIVLKETGFSGHPDRPKSDHEESGHFDKEVKTVRYENHKASYVDPTSRLTLLTVAQAAAISNTSKNTILRAIASGVLRVTTLGSARGYRIELEWLEDWIERRARGPAPPKLRQAGDDHGQLMLFRDLPETYAESRKNQPRRKTL
jgi:excisionase family DNA binding protein